MLEERSIVDAVTYRDSGHIQVKTANVVLRDGVEIARSYHRHVVEPGADVTGEDPKVQAIADALWTPELIDAYRAHMESASQDEAAPPVQEDG
jgi:hypothetical protein